MVSQSHDGTRKLAHQSGITINIGLRGYPFFLGLCIVVTVLANSWSDFGFPSFVTGTRVGMMLMFAGVLALLAANPSRSITVTKRAGLLAGALAFVGLWALLSFVLASTQAQLAHIVSWFTAAACVTFFGVLLQRAFPLRFLVNAIILISFIFTLHALAVLVANVDLSGLAGTGLRARQTLNNAFSIGLNRHMSGLFLVNLVSVSSTLHVLKTTTLFRLLSYCSTVVLGLLFLFSGSRQNLFALVLYVILLLIVSRVARWRGLQRPRHAAHSSIVPIVVLVAALAVGLAANPQFFDWVESRFVQSLLQSSASDSDSLRREILLVGIESAIDNPIFGTGPGTFNTVHGMYAHNSYVQLAAEIGVAPTLVIIFASTLTLVLIYRDRPRYTDGDRYALFVTFFTGICVFLGWSANLNELIEDPAVWLLLITASSLRASP